MFECHYALQGETIQFETNGEGGILEATGGTVLPSLKWQAPFQDGVVNFTYRVGSVTATYQLTVVEKLVVDGVRDDGYYKEDMAQGEVLTLVTTCADAVFSSPNYPALVTQAGQISAPIDAKDDVFGEKDIIVKVVGCGQEYIFHIRVLALFPVPKFCGAVPNRWEISQPSFKPNIVEMLGGTTQRKNRIRFDKGIITTEIEYINLPIGNRVECLCPSTNHSCEDILATAKRLDDFYLQHGLVRDFSVMDYQTGTHYKFVHMTKYDGNHHELYEFDQFRDVTLRYEGGGFAVNP